MCRLKRALEKRDRLMEGDAPVVEPAIERWSGSSVDTDGEWLMKDGVGTHCEKDIAASAQ